MLINLTASQVAFETPHALYAMLCAVAYGKRKLNINQLPLTSVSHLESCGQSSMVGVLKFYYERN